MINFHYLNRYNRIIEHYRNKVIDQQFVEKHHIIPKCKGGNNDTSNIIVLPARVHFICHYLLHKAYPNDKQLAHAFAMMIVNNLYQSRNSRLYERAKMARSLALKGIPRPEYVKEKLRKPKKNKENYKKPKSESHKKNIGKKLKGKKHDWHHKIVESEGFKKEQERRKNETIERKNFHRNNFLELKIFRKEYYKLYPEISNSTLKRYLSGL